MGHVDRSELDPYRPLISISYVILDYHIACTAMESNQGDFPCRLGHAGVFLLGGTTRQTPPVPIVLRSGDVLVMAGRGRKCYHGQSRGSALHCHTKTYASADEEYVCLGRQVYRGSWKAHFRTTSS